MKRLAIFAGLLLALAVPQIKADDCATVQIRGSYSFVASGTLAGQPFAAAGQGIYDAIGGVQGVIQTSVGGVVTPPSGWTGKYTLTAMPTGAGETACVLNETITITRTRTRRTLSRLTPAVELAGSKPIMGVIPTYMECSSSTPVERSLP